MIKDIILTAVLFICLPAGSFCQTLKDSLAAIVVLNPADTVPVDAIAMRKEIKIIDHGFAVNCSYQDVLAEGKEKVLRTGANVLKIIEWRIPGNKSPCFGLKGQSYQVQNVAALRKQLDDAAAVAMKSYLPDSAEYAVLHIYQPGGLGALNSYNVMISDSVVCRVKDSHYYRVKIRREGKVMIRAGKGTEGEVSLDIRFGQAYFIKCGLSAGAFSSRPTLLLQTMKTAIEELQLYRLIKDGD